MERAGSARECVRVMGALAEEHGFYGADGFEGTGESLMVVDPNEGWIFHVLSDPTGQSAVWAGERVPDDGVGAVANMFTIRAVNLSQPERFMGSANMADLALNHNLSEHCSSTERCDFTSTFSDGEYAHKYYSGRRMWGAYRMLAPSYTASKLSPSYGSLKHDAPYPATVPVKPDELVSLQDLFAVHRSYYQGTAYDLSAGLAAGPYGTPNRFSAGKGESQVKGAWERPISLFRTSDSHVVQARSWLPDPVGGTLWFAPHCPQTSVYTPFPAGMARARVPYAYEQGHQARLDKRTAFWAHRSVAQLVDNKFRLAIKPVAAEYERLERQSIQLQAEWDQLWEAKPEYQLLDRQFKANAEQIVQAWWALFDRLLFEFADGWDNTPSLGQAIGYPAWWLSKVGYQDGPPPVLSSERFPRLPWRLAQASV